MSWLAENWLWLLLGGGMVAMHLFGHRHGGAGGGCCGGGDHRNAKGDSKEGANEAGASSSTTREM